ncbi:MAG: hypothetical protein M1389_08510 [Chloroflexi bacterium]|nr:hypothetical protein [Chloroflexota bacterium]
MDLVSPEYDFAAFCRSMIGKDYMTIIDDACAEATYAPQLHREPSGRSGFRKGSRGREYCDNLQRLVSLLVNGEVPEDATPEFLAGVEPLVQYVLRKREIGNLRQLFANYHEQNRLRLSASVDPLVVVVSKAEVAAQDPSEALNTLRRLTESPTTAREFVERVDLAFQGWDDRQDELYELQPVRNFVYQLDSEFPYWLFFLSKRHLGLHCVLRCLLPPFLTEEAEAQVFPERISQVLQRRWLPAMNQICDYVGFSETQNRRLTERAYVYVTEGRFPLDSKRFG